MKYIKKLLILFLTFSIVTGCSSKEVMEGKVINTSMFLYQVTDNEGNDVYLFGTCHPGRDEIKSLDHITEKALKESDSIYLECTLDTHEANQYKHYLAENSLLDLGLEDMYYNIMDKYSSLKGKTGYVTYNAMTISSLASLDKEICEKTKQDVSHAIDQYIYNYAIHRGCFKEIEGIEKQYKIFADLSKDYSKEILEGLNDKDRQIDGINMILDAYFDGNVNFFEKEQNQTLEDLSKLEGEAKEKSERYLNMLVYNRNVLMKETLINSLNNKKHDFIAVGVRHLYGQKGIIQLLKNDGYDVKGMKR